VGVVRAAGGNHIDFFPSALPAHARTHSHILPHAHTLIALTAVQRETFELSHVPRLSN
jgi:hypothetical protein